ncbi:TadE/TadG family type IV pilus assembly protein [Yersinia rochesterensis]|uniref:TadE/TadG family type IV pilus assembly protein n=1 Tax=Yersinia rochesterensis TaxID=1604335 RepID=UPI0025AA92F3|nr:TadE/TadG family type IV pilus assembly protein [Yersinia rochesterensis]MDN0108350.1 TadE/TadG family type IV pilus assembly protein [Yersinia rochesterensis]
MRKMNFTFLYENKGSITIEFSIVFILFLLMLLFSAEIARLLYISANLDLAVSEAAKSAKNKERHDDISYTSMLRQKLVSHQGVLGSFITEDNALNANVVFSENISDMINHNTSDNNKLPLAKYSVSYLYHPVFFPILSSWPTILLSREVILVQEK